MGDFRTALVEGDFDEKDGRFLVPYQGQTVNVEELLRPFLGEEVQMAIHYLPPIPPDMTRWGGGCCNFQETGFCPAGHHEDPYKLLNVSGQGVLRHVPVDSRCSWWLEGFDGNRLDMPLNLLIGHHARLAIATVFSVEKMRDAIGQMDPSQVESLGARVGNLKDILERLQKTLKEP